MREFGMPDHSSHEDSIMPAQRLTLEQLEVVEHYGDAVVQAAAGSGKSHTLREYARVRPDQSILYLVYNSSMRREAQSKFKGMEHVTVETGHSLAHKALEVGKKFVLRQQNFKVLEVAELCRLTPCEENGHLIVARHIINHLVKFMNSDFERPEQLNYLRDIRDPVARELVAKERNVIVNGSTFLFNCMRTGQIPLTHDAYMKLYQLSQPDLSDYDCIMVDEGQDTNPVLMDIFLRQKGTKVIVGDSYQQLYRWRGAVNSLGNVDFPKFYLSASFRFGQDIANLGMRALNLRSLFGYAPPPFTIKGLGQCSGGIQTSAVIARSNLILLAMAIEQVDQDPNQRFCFEGGLENYSFMAHGAELYDFVNLHLKNRDKIRGDFARQFQDITEVLQFAQQTDDMELKFLCGIVQRYKGALFPLMFKIKELQIPRKKAELIFSSVHRSKGQEYSHVSLTDGFINGQKIVKAIKKSNKTGEKPDFDAMAEEVNVLYTAITRAKGSVDMPFHIEGGKG